MVLIIMVTAVPGGWDIHIHIEEDEIWRLRWRLVALHLHRRLRLHHSHTQLHTHPLSNTPHTLLQSPPHLRRSLVAALLSVFHLSASSRFFCLSSFSSCHPCHYHLRRHIYWEEHTSRSHSSFSQRLEIKHSLSQHYSQWERTILIRIQVQVQVHKRKRSVIVVCLCVHWFITTPRLLYSSAQWLH